VAAAGELPGALRPGESRTDDGDCPIDHGRILEAVPIGRNPGQFPRITASTSPGRPAGGRGSRASCAGATPA
jgi:hypothetical protein